MKKGQKKGLVLVNTGNGKGKSTAAFGVIFRAIGRKKKSAVVQYIKGKWITGEALYAKELPEHITFFAMGLGFTWESEDLEQDKRAAQEAWQKSKEFIADEEHHIVLLDEITYAINYGFIELEDVLGTLKNKPEQKHVILTGRECPQEIMDLADCVTEMKHVKHPFDNDIPAQLAIDF